jgi:hypothetical protein
MNIAILDDDMGYTDVFEDKFLSSNINVEKFHFVNELFSFGLNHFDLIFIDHFSEHNLKGYEISKKIWFRKCNVDILLLRTFDSDYYNKRNLAELKHIKNTPNILDSVSKYDFEKIKEWIRYIDNMQSIKQMAVAI